MKIIKKNKITSSLFKSITIQGKNSSPLNLEIFQNPRKYEVREIRDYSEFSKETAPYVNFFIDFRHKTVYIWNGEYATHADVAPLIPLDMHREETIRGIAEILYPEYKLNALALYQGKRDFKVFEWEWLNRYFPKISDEYAMLAERKITKVDNKIKGSKKIASLYTGVPKILEQLNKAMQFFLEVSKKYGLSIDSKDWELDKKHIMDWKFTYQKQAAEPISEEHKFDSDVRAEFHRIIHMTKKEEDAIDDLFDEDKEAWKKAWKTIRDDVSHLRLVFKVSLGYTGSESLSQDVYTPDFERTIKIPLAELLMQNKKVTMDDFLKLVANDKKERKSKDKPKEEQWSEWLKDWVDIAFSTKPTAIGEELEELLPDIPEQFKEFKEYPFLYRCISVNTEYLDRIDAESLSIHMQDTKYTSWTFDLNAAKDFGRRYHQSTDTHTTVVLRVAASKLHPLLNVYKFGQYLSKKGFPQDLEVIYAEKEVIVKIPGGFTLQPSGVYLALTYPENNWHKY
jgi:hypothetical protein